MDQIGFDSFGVVLDTNEDAVKIFQALDSAGFYVSEFRRSSQVSIELKVCKKKTAATNASHIVARAIKETAGEEESHGK